MKRARVLAALLGAVLAAVLAALVLSETAAGGTIVVKPGDSIQDAVDAASPGDRIVVKGGVHREHVLVETDRITLIGKGAKVRPGTPHGDCDASGFCVVGEFDFETEEIGEPVKGVKIKGFNLRHFSADGVVAINAEDLILKRNKASRNDGYGLAAFISTGTKFVDNHTSRNAAAGIYAGDSPDADVTIKGNRTSRNLFGIFLRNAQTGTVEDNKVSHNCLGILILGGAPGPAGAFDIEENWVAHNTRFCPGMYGEPSFSGIGIALVGSHDVVVEHNDIVANRPSGQPDVPTGGVIVVTDPGLGVEPTGNRIEDNDFKRNEPDIFWDLTGTGNVFEDNDCDTSVPDGLCDG